MPTLISKLDLWPHQREAVNKMQGYITAFNRETKESALVQMPTGSGKTRVIAALARYLPEVACVLVLAPRIALRGQLIEKLNERFFRKGVAEPISLPKSVLLLTESNLNRAADAFDSRVFVSTIQKLDRMSGTDQRSFDLLAKHVKLVIVDEGHYEPALSWSETIRSFKVPRILFTATPFRNDYKPFDVDNRFAYSYPFHRAVAERFLREVNIYERPPTDDPNEFVDDIINFYDKHLKRKGPDAPRVIIRCDNKNSIRQIAQALTNRDKEFVAIHEEFENRKEIGEYHSVPNPKTTPATFWIHQFKLLEGIDDPRFQLVAMFEPLGTARQLIQQVGRVIRNTRRVQGAKAYVLDHSSGKQAEMWKLFRLWDEKIKAEDQLLSIGARFTRQLKELQAPAEYVDGRFRRKLDFDEITDISEEIQLPRAVNLLQKERNFDLDRFCQLLELRFRKQDQEFARYETKGAVVYMYLVYENSPFLRKSYFFQFSHGVMIIRDLGKYIAFFDSSDYVPMNISEAGIGKPLDSKSLRRLFPRQHSPARPDDSFLTRVSLKNSHLGNRSIRSRSFLAARVEETVPSLDDHAQIVISAFGYSSDRANTNGRSTKHPGLVRRYVGFNRGRVSQQDQKIPLAKYLEWLDDISSLVSKSRSSLETFKRYAPPAVLVKEPEPMNILLDLHEVQNDYLTVGNKKRRIKAGEELIIEDLCQPVTDGEFTLKVGIGRETFDCLLQVRYEKEQRRYVIESKNTDPKEPTLIHLERDYHTKPGLPHESVISYLNRTQSFRVLPKSENVIYVHGEYYRPVIKTGGDFDSDSFQVGKILKASKKLATVGDEKGKKCFARGKGWECGCLFDVIDKLGDGDADLMAEFGEPDILVCDDMGTEMGDFILADSDKRIVAFIHAKASASMRPYSASAIQEVCAQATKNINYLSMFNEIRPDKNIEKWKLKWTAPPKVKGTVKRRIRIPTRRADPEVIWEKIRSIITDPLARREVWLFLGQILSKSALEEQLRSSGAEAIQAAILLHGTMTNVAAIDAKLRVFCSE
jgi:superfamily II DNA or RNA helicase